MGSLAEAMATIHCDAAEVTALSTAMAPTYAVVLRGALGVAEGASEGHLGSTVSSHLSEICYVLCLIEVASSVESISSPEETEI